MRKTTGAPLPPGFKPVAPEGKTLMEVLAPETELRKVFTEAPPDLRAPVPPQRSEPARPPLPNEESLGAACEAAFADRRVVSVGRETNGDREWYVAVKNMETGKARWFYGGSIRLALLRMMAEMAKER
jgi:hypothetical protein